MPIVTGTIDHHGPVIDVLVAVSKARRGLLLRNQMSVPEPVPVRVLIDTGSSHTLFSPQIFHRLGLTPVGKEMLLTPSTPADQPHPCDVYFVSLFVVANGFPHEFGDRRVVGADCFGPRDDLQGLIGRDMLARCNMWYLGRDRAFTLNF